MAVSRYDIDAAHQLAASLRALASNVEREWAGAPLIPQVWIGHARNDHQQQIDKVDRRVQTAASKLRSVAAKVSDHGDALDRQWRAENDSSTPNDLFGFPWTTGGA